MRQSRCCRIAARRLHQAGSYPIVVAQPTSRATNSSSSSSRDQHAPAPPSRLCTLPPSTSRSLHSSPATRRAPGTRPGGLSGAADGETEADLGRHFYLNKVLETWAARPATRMTLRQLIFFGKTLGKDREKILKSAAYVRQELPVRIAHRIRDLQALPFVVMTNKHLEDVYNKYWSAFETLRRFPPIRTMDENERFCTLLKGLLDDHLTIIPSLTIGIVESSHHLPPHQLDKFMERMLRSRISRRVLAEQHIALSEALDDPFHFFNEPVRRNDDEDFDEEHEADLSGNHVGIIYTHLNVASVVRKGSRLLTEVFAGAEAVPADRVPAIQVDGDLTARFAYIPEHLEYIVFELLKNAIRSTIRNHAGREDPGVVRVTIVEGPPEEDLIIRISDTGGGMPDVIEQLTLPRPQVAGMEQHYPIPFPETGHVGGYAATSKHASAPMPISSQDYGAGSIGGGAGPSIPSSSAGGTTSNNVIRGGIGSAGGIAGTATGGEYLHPSSSSPSHAVHVTSSQQPTVSPDSLIDALCSFSNVRRRLELEEEAARMAALRLSRSSPSREDGGGRGGEEERGGYIVDAASSEAVAAVGEEGEGGGGGAAASSSSSTRSTHAVTGPQTPTRDQFHALRKVGKFKGTVGEQMSPSFPNLPPSPSPPSPSNSPSSTPSGITPPPPPGGTRQRAYEGTGPAALHTVQVETGLGLPMAKVYCDFFGGSLSLRSLDGHSTDVYVRLPKLGTVTERIDEVVL